MNAAIPMADQTASLLMRCFESLASAGKARIMAASVLLILMIAILDSRFDVSLGVLYIVPMILAAAVLSPVGITLMAFGCAILRGFFDNYVVTIPDHILRFILAAIAYNTTGLYITVLFRSRQQALAHAKEIALEHTLRSTAEDQLQTLVESSPAAILTLDHAGSVIAANRAAAEILDVEESHILLGQPIRDYIPLLYDALKFDAGKELFRTAAQCQGRRQNGEPFLAHTWFSTYPAPNGRHLAAIVVDASEEMRNQEEQKFQQLAASSRIVAAAASHEIRNLCKGIAFIHSSLRETAGLSDSKGFQALGELVKGLEEMATLDLNFRSHETLEPISLQPVLDNLRIIVEPDWDEIEGTIRWEIPSDLPPVWADSSGLLQALLNLARNSHRAVQDQSVRQLVISVSTSGEKVLVQMRDSGPGIPEPGSLFQPFQKGAIASGLGLYISRASLRSYGGELRLEPDTGGTCFTVELQSVPGGGRADSAIRKN
jgi:two-component system, LuxR family, sensor kinase FixL